MAFIWPKSLTHYQHWAWCLRTKSYNSKPKFFSIKTTKSKLKATWDTLEKRSGVSQANSCHVQNLVQLLLFVTMERLWCFSKIFSINIKLSFLIRTKKNVDDVERHVFIPHIFLAFRSMADCLLINDWSADRSIQ